MTLILFLGLALWNGGEKFRWFGKSVREESEKIGRQADRIKETSVKITNALQDTKETIKGFTGKGKDSDDRSK